MKTKTRLIGILVCLVMLIGIVPLSVFAEEEGCPHTNLSYIENELKDPSCFEPGLSGYWMCEECGQYLDISKEHGYWEEPLASKIPALGHAFNADTGSCDHCGLANSIYSKVTSLDDINEEDMYIIVAEAGGRYFVLGGLDESTATSNEQGIVDCVESGNAIEVIPYDDGSISLLNQNYVGNARPSEFMFDIDPEQFNSDLDDNFGLTPVILKLPNYCIYPFQSYSLDNTGYIGVPRYANDMYGMWDATEWILDFYTTEVDENTYRDDMDGLTHAEQVARGNIGDNISEGDLLMYRGSYYAVGGAMFTLRFREYVNEEGGTEYYFICGEDWALVGSDGWDYVTDTTPTNDIQYAISLYRYDVIATEEHVHNFIDGKCECGEEDPNYVPPHEHSWSNATCTEPSKCECGATQGTALGHNFAEGICTVCGANDPGYVPPHNHVFVDGKCECGEEDPNYVPPHNHVFVDGKCECGEEDPNYVPPHNHVFVDGKCECGEEDPNYVPPHEHSWSNATCTEPSKCECGATQGTALGHSFAEGICTVCGANDPGYVPPHNHVFVDGRCECGAVDPNYVPPHNHVFVDGKCECGEEDPNYVPPHEHKFGDWICEATVIGKHYRECECGERENGDCQWDDGKITLEPDYDTYGEKTYTCTLCGGTKKESIDKLVSVDEIVSPDNENIKVEVPAGSNASIAHGTIIDADEVMTPFSSEVKANIETVAGKGAEIIIAYDLSLLLDGAEVQPDGMIKVTVPAPIEASKYESIKVVYIDSNGVAIVCETTVNADGTVSFLTNHFSRYAVIGVPKNSPNVIVILALVAVVLLVGVALILHGKKKTDAAPVSEAALSPDAEEAPVADGEEPDADSEVLDEADSDEQAEEAEEIDDNE